MRTTGAFIGLLLGGWRLWRVNPRLFYYRVWSIARSPAQGLRDLLAVREQYAGVQEAYREWLRCPHASEQNVDFARGSPLLSVVMPVYDPEARALAAAIESVVHQTYENWELCIADDVSTTTHVRPMLEGYAARDGRIRIVWREQQGHIAAASNSAVEIARGDFVVLLDHDDLLAPNALAEVARVIEANSTVDFIYSDEDKLDFDDTHIEPFFKPAWSPTLLATCNYITHLAALRRRLVLEVGGFQDETVGSQDHDLFLRVTERSRAVAHIPQVLYSWRKSRMSTAVGSSAKPYATEAARRALQRTIDRRALNADIQPSDLNGLFHMRRRLASVPRVSLVVLGKGREWQSILDSHDVVVCDRTHLPSSGPAVDRLYDSPGGGSDIPVVDSVADLTGDYLVWIDGRTRPADRHSVRNLLEMAQVEGVSVVGGVTLDRRTAVVLQAGIVIGERGQPVYAYAGLPRAPQRAFYLNLKDLSHEVSAVYYGCCAMRRTIWEELEWNAQLPPALAMCDLCLRTLEAGYTPIYAPLARFQRSTPLDPMPSIGDYDWPWRQVDDPFWNPHLGGSSPDGLPFRCSGEPAVRVRRGGSTLEKSHR
jgi:O-antigen biosynthesis protein